MRAPLLATCIALALAGCTPGSEGPRAALVPVDDGEEPPAARPERSHACAASLEACPAIGCAGEGTPLARFNAQKHGSSQGSVETAVPVTVDQLVRLQRLADQAGIRRLDYSAATRRLLAGLSLDQRPLGEGTWVRLAGVLLPAGDDPQRHHGVHASSGETVNCRLRGESHNDYHLPILPAPGASECASATAEMIPQGRPAAWSLPRLRDQLAARGARVMVVGPLFYDNAHEVNADCAAPRRGDPKRATLFEVHPVVALFVCPDDACSPGSLKGWQRIE